LNLGRDIRTRGVLVRATSLWIPYNLLILSL
jgi:hypothetical protein